MVSSKVKTLAVFSILLFLLAGCPQQPPQPAANKTAAYGDTVYVDYILHVNITDYATNTTKDVVYDTSLADVANASGIYNANRSYFPMIVKMDSTNGLLPAFTRGMVGMGERENKTFVIKPKDAYGSYNYSKVFTRNRTYVQSRYETWPVEYFDLYNLSHEPGTTLSSQFFTEQVVNSTNTTVTIKHMVAENDAFFVGSIPERVVSFNDDNMTIEVLAGTGNKYKMPAQGNATALTVTVIRSDNSTITFDSNYPLAGKELRFTVFMRQIEKQ